MVGQLFDISHGNDFFYVTPKTNVTKVKIKQARLHQTEKLLHKQRNHQQSEKATYGIRKN